MDFDLLKREELTPLSDSDIKEDIRREHEDIRIQRLIKL